MRVLVACEFSGTVRRAFVDRGHIAVSCDLLPAQDGAPWGDKHSPIGNHYQGDVRDLLRPGWWDLLIAHPTCTRLCNSGAHWLHRRALWDELSEAVAFFRLFLDAPVDHICVENPLPHMYARSHMWGGEGFQTMGKNKPYAQIIQPWQYGADASKATCLWLKRLPRLRPLPPALQAKPRYVLVNGKRLPRWSNQTDSGQNVLSPGAMRGYDRARTYPGVARAMARHWSEWWSLIAA
jgi:hypothetical protein